MDRSTKIFIIVILAIFTLFACFVVLSFVWPGKGSPVVFESKEIEFNYPRRGQDKEY
jgi:hypothetical protein